MNLHVTGHHLDVTPAIQDYVANKMERVKRHFEQVIDTRVTLVVEKLVHRVEVNLHVSGKDIFVESHDADMYAAIDLVIDKLDRQVIKFKNKTANHAHEALKHKVVE